ncbi:MAG TPA: cupredoxin family copper-binding protein [Xanthobacteraceae bacterium]|jgi:plastocyanin
MKLKSITCLVIPFAAGILVAAAISFPVISAQPSDSKVEIDNFTFAPGRVTVKAGTTVTWLNADDIPHTVTSASRQFRSKALDTDDSFSFTFTTPGVYEYFCSLHPRMTGTVVVETTSGSGATQ